MITQSALHQLFTYNKKTGQLFWKERQSSSCLENSPAGFSIPNGYISIKIKQKRYSAHRLIYIYHFGKAPKYIDHINRIRNDNRIENLRPATISQNNHNANLRKDNGSGIKGVSFYKKLNKWIAYINVNKKRVHLGYFDFIDDAFNAVSKKRKELHGEYASNG